jgi:hypothetical protein
MLLPACRRSRTGAPQNGVVLAFPKLAAHQCLDRRMPRAIELVIIDHAHNLDGGGESNRANQIGAAFLYLANKVKFAASAPISLILAFVEFPSDIRDAQDDL